jgi:hypothetical protein
MGVWGGVAHRSSALHGSVDRSAGNEGEGGLSAGNKLIQLEHEN